MILIKRILLTFIFVSYISLQLSNAQPLRLKKSKQNKPQLTTSAPEKTIVFYSDNKVLIRSKSTSLSSLSSSFNTTVSNTELKRISKAQIEFDLRLENWMVDLTEYSVKAENEEIQLLEGWMLEPDKWLTY